MKTLDQQIKDLQKAVRNTKDEMLKSEILKKINTLKGDKTVEK